MKRKLKLVVLMGGKSSERKISLLSGKEILSNIDRNKYSVYPVDIPKNGSAWIDSLVKLTPDVVFIALHGAFGEDGAIQGLMEQLGLRYTGSGILASAIGMDKIMFKKLMRQENIPVPKDVTRPPCFIKPNGQGSSVGASAAFNRNEFESGVKLAKKYSKDILVEEYLTGVELTCAVIGNEKPIALPVVEICPLKGNFFDYRSKYTKSGSEEIVPARISDALTKKVKKLAVQVYTKIGCKGFARVDFILKDGEYPVILEINTIPGLTKMSLLPKSANAEGISYSELIDRIISFAVVK